MSSSASEALLFFALVINGGLAGAIYALIALAFVLVYKASRMINFALGEWIMFGSLLASTGSHTIGLDLGGAVLFGCVGMTLLGIAFNAIVQGRLVMRPVISLIMVTLGLGALMRGVAALCFRGVPGAMILPVSTDPVSLGGIDIAGDKLVAASVAAGCVCLVSWFFHGSRTGIALRAIADDPAGSPRNGDRYPESFRARLGGDGRDLGDRWGVVDLRSRRRLWCGARWPQSIPDCHHRRARQRSGHHCCCDNHRGARELGNGVPRFPPGRRIWQCCLLCAASRYAHAATVWTFRAAEA